MVQLYGNKKWLFQRTQVLGTAARHALPAIFGIQVRKLHPEKCCLLSLVFTHFRLSLFHLPCWGMGMSSKSPTFLPDSRLSSKKQDQMAASVHARKRQGFAIMQSVWPNIPSWMVSLVLGSTLLRL